MIVHLGAQVIGNDGELGRIAGFTIDPNSQSADQMLIKHGLPFHSGHLAVLGHVIGVEADVVRVDLSKDDLQTLEQYDRNAYHDDDAGVSTMPPTDLQEKTAFQYGSTPGLPPAPNTSGTETPRNDTHRMTPTYPAQAESAPEDKRLTVISEGTDVWDKDGEKVGRVYAFAVDTATGRPTQIALRDGLLGQKNLELPMDWVERYTPKGVALSVSKTEIRARAT